MALFLFSIEECDFLVLSDLVLSSPSLVVCLSVVCSVVSVELVVYSGDATFECIELCLCVSFHLLSYLSIVSNIRSATCGTIPLNNDACVIPRISVPRGPQ